MIVIELTINYEFAQHFLWFSLSAANGLVVAEHDILLRKTAHISSEVPTWDLSQFS